MLRVYQNAIAGIHGQPEERDSSPSTDEDVSELLIPGTPKEEFFRPPVVRELPRTPLARSTSFDTNEPPFFTPKSRKTIRKRRPSVASASKMRLSYRRPKIRKRESILEPFRELSSKWKHLLSPRSLENIFGEDEPGAVYSIEEETVEELDEPMTPSRVTKPHKPAISVVTPSRSKRLKLSSNAYLAWLIVWCIRYLTFLFIKSSYGDILRVLTPWIVTTVTIHISYNWSKYLLTKYTRLPASFPIFSAVSSVGHRFKQSLKGLIKANMNQIMALFVIFLCGSTAFISSSVMMLKVQQASFLSHTDY